MADKREKREEGEKNTTPKEVPKITLIKNSVLNILIWQNRFLQGTIDIAQEGSSENIPGSENKTEMDEVSKWLFEDCFSEEVCIKYLSSVFLWNLFWQINILLGKRRKCKRRTFKETEKIGRFDRKFQFRFNIRVVSKWSRTFDRENF